MDTSKLPLEGTAAPDPVSIETRMRLEIREIGIPPRPTILAQIESESAKDEPDFIKLAKLLNQDVGLAAGMIKVANSPYFSFNKKIPTVHEALLVLGLKLVIRTVAGLALRSVFQHVPNMERFWDASARTAEISACLAKQIGRSLGIRPEDAHTFALFRDCGIPMLMIPFPEYRSVLERANQEAALPFTQVEEEAMGLNHAVLGAQLAEDWLLPAETSEAIRHHHHQQAIDGRVDIPRRSRQLIAIAQVAEYLLQQKTGLTRNCEWLKLGDACLECLELTPESLDELAEHCTAAIGS